MMSEGSSCNSIKRETLTQMFNSDVCNIFKSICFIEYLCWLLLKKQKDTSKCIFLTTWWNSESNSLVIKQKGESQNGCFKKTKPAKFSEKRTFLTPCKKVCCAYQGVINTRFSENLACFVFLKPPFWDSPFCLITDELSFRERHSQMLYKTYEGLQLC